MSWLTFSQQWFRLLTRLYPPDFRDEMGTALVEAYMDRARDTLKNKGKLQLMTLWLRALLDSLRNGSAEQARRPHPGGEPETGAATSNSSGEG